MLLSKIAPNETFQDSCYFRQIMIVRAAKDDDGYKSFSRMSLLGK